MFVPKILLLTILLFITSLADNISFSHELKESSSDLKATYIYNIINYITKQGKNKKGKKFTICLYKRKDLLRSLQQYKGKEINSMQIHLREINNNKQCLTSCQMVILPKLEDTKLSTFIKKAKDKNVITISDIAGCAKKGVMIYLKDLTSKIEFEMNLKEMRKADIKLSSRILKLSTIIER